MNDGLALVRSGELLYTDDVGHDACGIGGVAARDGKPSSEVVKRTLLALRNVEHRGGICGQTGDGAGLTCQLPQGFFKEEARGSNSIRRAISNPKIGWRSVSSSSSTRNPPRSSRLAPSSMKFFPMVRFTGSAGAAFPRIMMCFPHEHWPIGPWLSISSYCVPRPATRKWSLGCIANGLNSVSDFLNTGCRFTFLRSPAVW